MFCLTLDTSYLILLPFGIIFMYVSVASLARRPHQRCCFIESTLKHLGRIGSVANENITRCISREQTSAALSCSSAKQSALPTCYQLLIVSCSSIRKTFMKKPWNVSVMYEAACDIMYVTCSYSYLKFFGIYWNIGLFTCLRNDGLSDSNLHAINQGSVLK